MTAEQGWRPAFPLRPLTDAVDALCESWRVLAAIHRPHFHPRISEPSLTRVLKVHVENVTARQRGLLGMWSAETVINRVNFETGELIEERRTDIVYGWNDEKIGIQLVFEFKKLSRHKRSQTNYLGQNGLLRFVTGIYGQRQPIAAMVGILIDSFERCVPQLREALADVTLARPLRLRPTSTGYPYHRPSQIFPDVAEFDTEHDKSPEGTGTDEVVRVAHLFFPFDYAAANEEACDRER